MSYLLYGIVHGDRLEPREKHRFIGYPRASIMARSDRLGAIASRLSSADADPDVMRLLVYSKIVESFNHERAVIPMRYGCRFKTIDDIVDFLKREQNTFGALLSEIDGRVEMSASVNFDLPRENSVTHPDKSPSTAKSSAMKYLAGRQQHYSLVDEAGAQREEVRKSLCAMVEGKFVRAINEKLHHEQKSELTVHFLVPRDGIAEFTRALRAKGRPSITVSGPWPPYNFVSTKTRALAI
jgi:hypothetical protein